MVVDPVVELDCLAQSASAGYRTGEAVVAGSLAQAEGNPREVGRHMALQESQDPVETHKDQSVDWAEARKDSQIVADARS